MFLEKNSIFQNWEMTLNETFIWSPTYHMNIKFSLGQVSYNWSGNKHLMSRKWNYMLKTTYMSFCNILKWIYRIVTYTALKVFKYGVFSSPYFPGFGLNKERYPVSLRIQSKCRKIQTRKNSVFAHFLRTDRHTPEAKISNILRKLILN